MNRPDFDDRSRGGQDDVRHVLRLLRRPHELTTSTIAMVVCESVGVEDPVEAVESLLRQIFNLRTQTGRRLYDSIRLCDVDGLAAKEVANVMGLSLRQFFRYRREAVNALADKIKRLAHIHISLAS
ncbi:MAG TPA: hypothetical protein VJN22_05195 [Candidatus Eremiobacteraceae bacterium]|nr:hypothetical protein [Candidatus Eremiobacteraceae bacterium]